MKKRNISFVFLAIALAATAVADSGYIARARVVNTQPIIDTVYEQVEICRYQYQKQSIRGGLSDNTGKKIIGGVLGGAAGSAVGKGSGRDAAAAIGAIIGSEVGDDNGVGGGEIIGGVAGGLLGNQIGKGSGKTAATAAGALIGALVGDVLQNGAAPTRSVSKKKVRVCEVTEEPKKVIVGYDVELEHDGFRFSDIVDRRPGEYIDIYVNLQILDNATTSQVQ